MLGVRHFALTFLNGIDFRCSTSTWQLISRFYIIISAPNRSRRTITFAWLEMQSCKLCGLNCATGVQKCVRILPLLTLLIKNATYSRGICAEIQSLWKLSSKMPRRHYTHARMRAKNWIGNCGERDWLFNVWNRVRRKICCKQGVYARRKTNSISAKLWKLQCDASWMGMSAAGRNFGSRKIRGVL